MSLSGGGGVPTTTSNEPQNNPPNPSKENEMTGEDLFRIKCAVTSSAGASDTADPSVISLADSSSNFDEHVGDEFDEVETADTENSQTVDLQSRIFNGWMFDRKRPSNMLLPQDTVTILKYPKNLPIPPCPDGVNQLSWTKAFEEATVYLIGTAHFSKESQEDVVKTIAVTQPDLVMVELCPSRISILSMDERTLLKEASELNTQKILTTIKQSGVVQGILHVLLLSMSAHITRELSMAPGGEFRAAHKAVMQTQTWSFLSSKTKAGAVHPVHQQTAVILMPHSHLKRIQISNSAMSTDGPSTDVVGHVAYTYQSRMENRLPHGRRLSAEWPSLRKQCTKHLICDRNLLCRLVLGDRPIHVTLQRALGSLNFWQKIKFFWHVAMSHSASITPEEVEKCKQRDLLEQLLAEMAGDFPKLTKIFVDERDAYMTHALHSLLQKNTLEKRLSWERTDVEWQPLSVVAVVGIGHTPGIVAQWDNPVDIGPLLHVPPPSTSAKVARLAFRAAFWGAMGFLLYRGSLRVVRRFR